MKKKDWEDLQQKCKFFWIKNQKKKFWEYDDDFASYCIIDFIQRGYLRPLKYLAIDFGRKYNLFGANERSTDAFNALNIELDHLDKLPENFLEKTDSLRPLLNLLNLSEESKNWICNVRKNWSRSKTHAPYYKKKKLQKLISYT